MSRVSCKTGARYIVIGLTLGGLAISSVFTAKAGDLDLPVYGAHPYPAPVERDALCRILLERRVDPYGRETVHRLSRAELVFTSGIQLPVAEIL